MQCVWHSVQEGREEGDGSGRHDQRRRSGGGAVHDERVVVESADAESSVLLVGIRRGIPVHGRRRRRWKFGYERRRSVHVVAFQRHRPARPGSWLHEINQIAHHRKSEFNLLVKKDGRKDGGILRGESDLMATDRCGSWNSFLFSCLFILLILFLVFHT